MEYPEIKGSREELICYKALPFNIKKLIDIATDCIERAIESDVFKLTMNNNARDMKIEDGVVILSPAGAVLVFYFGIDPAEWLSRKEIGYHPDPVLGINKSLLLTISLLTKCKPAEGIQNLIGTAVCRLIRDIEFWSPSMYRYHQDNIDPESSRFLEVFRSDMQELSGKVETISRNILS